MHTVARISSAALAAAVLAVLASTAVAQEATSVWTCLPVGASEQAPVGDREGHLLTVSVGTCQITGGLLAGGVSTTTNIWQWDGPKATLVATTGVIRKPGATVVYSNVTGNLANTMDGDKVTGLTGSGTHKFLLGTGSWAPLTGKSDTWTVKSAKVGYTVESKFD